MLAMIGVLAVGMAILFLYGIMLIGLLIGLTVSATYTIKAINGLYRSGKIPNAVRILCIIGSLIIPFDIPIAIGVWGFYKRKREE